MTAGGELLGEGHHGSSFADLPGGVDDEVITLQNQPIEFGESIEGWEHVVNVTLAGTSRVEPAHWMSFKGGFIVKALEVVADEDEGCPVVGVGEVLGAFFVRFVEADSGSIGGVFEREVAVD